MAEFKKVTKRNHVPKRGTDNQFLVYSTQFNEMVDALNDGTGDLNINDAVVTGDLTVTGTTTLNGNLVLGDAASDSLTVNATVTQGAPVNYSNATTITAFATGGQASATALTEEINNVTTVATAGDSVKLPAAVAGMHIHVKNSGAAALDIFPATSDSIDALAVNLAIRIQPGSSVDFYAKDAIVWESNIDETFTLMAPTTNTGALVLKAVASAGNFNTQIQNASQAAARVYTIPDAGANASFVQTEGAQTINGIKTFGSGIVLPAGAVGTPSAQVGAVDTGLYQVSGSQTGFAQDGVLVGGFNTTGLFTDVIAEQTVATGVTIDGTLLQDGGLYATTEVEAGAGGFGSSAAGGFTAGVVSLTTQDNIAAAAGGAISIVTYYTTINTDAGGDAFTLADGSVKGQLKKIHLITDGGGDAVITVTLSAGTTLTMADAGDFAILMWAGAGTSWFPIELGNTVDGISAPVVS